MTLARRGSARQPVENRKRSWQVCETWVDFMIGAAREFRHRDAATVFVDALALKPGYQGLCVQGNVPPHTDRAFPEWVYMLVFRADDAVMHCYGHPPMRLKPGMLFEFNEHRRHRVEQDPSSTMIWTPLDSDRRLTFDEAMDLHRRQFAQGSSSLLSGSVPREIVTRKHRIVHDGRILRAYDNRNFCVAFLNRSGLAMACEEAGSVAYPMSFKRRPRVADWDRLNAMLELHHELTLPPESMPHWLAGTADAHR